MRATSEVSRPPIVGRLPEPGSAGELSYLAKELRHEAPWARSSAVKALMFRVAEILDSLERK